MATQSHAQAVKSLNKGAGRRRFVFKTFSQRIEEIDVDVYRSLDPLKQEPSEGSSFFRDCLVEWRELNTAEDFISFYEEMLPLVQTLPQIILQKETILSELLKRLDMKGRLSLEPILRLIAALSRDILEDFIPFLERVADSMVSLLSSGADRESEIIEQIFTSWSCIMMYLQKYLIKDVVHILKVTTKMRFYPKDYIQEFMAESASFLLRNAPIEQLNRGMKKIMSEVVAKPLDARKSGASALLFYVMKGFSSKFHSRAEHVIRLLLHSEVIGSGDKDSEDSNPVVEVLITVSERLCEDLKPSELKLLLQCEREEIHGAISSGHTLHLTHLLSLLISTMQSCNVHKIIEFEPVLELAKLLIQTFILKKEDQSSELIDKILQFFLCIIDGLHNGDHVTALDKLSVQWAPVFEMRNKSFMSFIKELLSKDTSIIQIFRFSIISVLSDVIMTMEDEAMYLFINFFEKLQSKEICVFEKKPREQISKVSIHLKEQITCYIGKINDAVHKDPSSVEFSETDLGRMWGTVTCYSYMTEFQDNPSLLMDFVEVVDRLLTVNSELPRRNWEALIGVGLISYQKLGFSHDKIPVDRYLYFAQKYKSSVHILSAVADFLDSFDTSTIPADGSIKKYHPELEAGKTVNSFDIFSDNLCHSDKQIRLLTLRILCHYESLTSDNSQSNQPSENVLNSLLAIESTSLSIATSRKVILLITKIQMDLSTGRIHSAYIPLVFNSIIGIFHNQFSYLWNPAMECFAVLVSSYQKLVWEMCIKYLEKCISNFISHQEHSRNNNESSDSPDDLLSCFNAFVGPSFDDVASQSVLSLLIKALQKVPIVVESRSRQIIPLFLKFLGYEADDLLSVRSYNLEASKGKSWKGVLEEWLNLLKSLHNPKSFYRSQFLKEVLQYRLLDENDPELQMKVLDCLLNWKDEYLLPYSQNLKNLVNTKTLRDELTRWSVSRESNLISEEHRDSLVPLVIRILVPKVRKLKTLASRKAASMHHRKAVIAFLAELDINELPLFFALLIKPLQTGSSGDDDVDELLWGPPKASTNFDSSGVLRHFTMDNIRALSSKKIYGFLHVAEEIFGVFDESRIKPVLDTLMGSVVRVLASCACSMDVSDDMCIDDEDNGAEKQPMTTLAPKQFKDLRSLCLKIISLVLSKFENHDFSLEFWDIFFSALKPLIDGFKQEGASSDKPSSLFVCFLAMSRSPKLVSLFHRAKNLVPDIFSILTVPTASEAIISCVLRFIENLLNLDNEVESDDTGVKGILLPNIDTLVCSLHHLFTSKSTKRQSYKSPGGKELNIFKLLPKYIKDPSVGKKFVDILIPSLTKKHLDWDSCVETLQVIQTMVPMLGNESSSRILKIVSPLLINATTEVRLAICDTLDALNETDPSFVNVAKLLREFNAQSPMEIDAIDYTVVEDAYKKIKIEFFCNVSEDQALAILSQCVHDMSSNDLALRVSAYSILLMFVDFCHKILHTELLHITGGWSDLRIQNTVNDFLLKYMGEAMDKETSVKKVWMDLLREMAFKLPEVSNLESIQALSSDNVDLDFFSNIVHLQKHRRARTLSRLCGIVRTTHLSDIVTNKVILPLLFNMLLEVKDGKGEHLRNSCIEALASVSGSMEWRQYSTLLNRCFQELKLKPEQQKLFLRLIFAILENYHFAEDLDVQNRLQESFLPKVQKLLTLDTEKVNVNISLVALKVLKLLPGDILELQLPTIIHRVANFIKDRLESVRDEARSALSACLKVLGLEYLQFVVRILKSTLKRGFQVHVLGYTLNFILTKALSGPVSGQLDYCLEEILSIAENDILGDVSDEKDVELIASKMKETRKKKSFETLKLIAQSVTFKTHALKLISPVTRHLDNQFLTPKLKSKLETMLQNIASGIECNPTVVQKDILMFVYGLIDDGLKGKSSQCSHLVTIFALNILHKRIKKMKIKENETEALSLLDPFVGLLCSCLTSKYEDITSTALRCLSLVVKVPLPSLHPQADNIKTALFGILHGSVKATSPLAESCLRLLTVLLKSTSITLSNDQMHMLLQFPLFVDIETNPSFVALSLLKAIVNRKVVVPEIYDLATQVSKLMVTSQVEPVRKKCSKIFLQFLLDYHIKKKRLQQHLDFLLSNLRYEHATGREAVLEMLHAILKKFPQEMLDEKSKTVFLQLVVCLANDSEKTVRAMAGAAIKFLVGRVGPQSQNSIFGDTLSWYTGENQSVWSTAAQVLGLMVEAIGEDFSRHVDAVLPRMRHLLPSTLNILKNQDPSTVPLWKVAYYSLVLFEKILTQFSSLCLEKDLEDFWEIISELLLHPHMWLRNISNRLISFYFTTAIEKCSRDNEKWIGDFLLMRPSRLFMLAASFCSQLKASHTDESANNYLRLNIVSAILGLHSILGNKLEAQMFWSSIDEKDEEILIKAFMILDSRKGRSMFASLSSGLDDVANFERHRDLLISSLLKKMGKLALDMEEVQMRIVFDSFRQISPKILKNKILKKSEEGLVEETENSFKQISPEILKNKILKKSEDEGLVEETEKKDDSQSYVYHVVLPLYKICEGFAGKVISDEVKQFAEEVRDSIKGAIGMEEFVRVYSLARKNLKAKRDKRRQSEKVMAVVNPMRNAKRKLRIAEKHKQNKKRKIMTMKFGRWVN